MCEEKRNNILICINRIIDLIGMDSFKETLAESIYKLTPTNPVYTVCCKAAQDMIRHAKSISILDTGLVNHYYVFGVFLNMNDDTSKRYSAIVHADTFDKSLKSKIDTVNDSDRACLKDISEIIKSTLINKEEF